MIIVASSESTTPFIAEWGDNFVQSFNIDGCQEQWCELSDRKSYHIEVNLTMRKFLQFIFLLNSTNLNFISK